MATKEDDLLENSAIIRRIRRLRQHRSLHGDGDQQNNQNRLKETPGNCLTALG
jgi:L-rhamnose isomerase